MLRKVALGFVIPFTHKGGLQFFEVQNFGPMHSPTEDGPDILDLVQVVGFCWPWHGDDVVQPKPFSCISSDVGRGVILLKMEVDIVQIFESEGTRPFSRMDI